MAVTLKISLNEDLRRLTVPEADKLTLTQLQETIQKLFTLNEQQFARLAIKYVDDEDDLVTVTTNEELLEALAVARRAQPQILRLHLKEKEEAKPCGEVKPDVQEPPFLQHLPPWARRAWKQRHGHFKGGCPAFGGGRRCGRGPWAEAPREPQELPPTKDDSRHPHTLYLNENPYGHGQYVCDGCSLPGQGRSYHCGQCNFDLHTSCEAARDAVNPWQRRRRWFQIHHEAMELMEKRTPEALARAKELLEEQLKLGPHHQASPLYNLACLEALRGNPEAALKYLQEAVQAGWSDAKHTEEDEDFASIRELDAFKAIVTALKADHGNKGDLEFHVELKERAKKMEERAKKLEDKAHKVEERAKKLEEKALKAQEKALKQEEKAVVKEEKAALKQAKVAQKEAAAQAAPVAPVAEPSAPLDSPTTVPLQPIYPALTPVAPAAPVDIGKSSSVADFDEKLKTLEQMGFVDRRRNITVLVRFKGDLVGAIQSLLDDALAQ